MAYDSLRGVTVLFGGRRSSQNYLDDTWEYDGTRWIERSFPLSPSSRSLNAMAYDEDREVTVLFGGRPNREDSALWEYDGTSWIERLLSPTPATIDKHTLSYDSHSRVVVLFGGESRNYNTVDETWVYGAI